jgi:retron-type reverse transcriptase
MRLEGQLKNGTYKSRPPHQFVITSPKRREIVSIHFRDRVYQRSLNDNVLYPDMVRPFIHANMACQKGKGTDAARELLKHNLCKAYRKWGTDFSVLQCDIKGYYPNMRHDVTNNAFERYVERHWFEQAGSILDAQYQGDVGYNPGSQMVQIAGIAVLNPFDHACKERLSAKMFERYMDDFYIISRDVGYLKRCESEIAGLLGGIGFTLNPEKTKIHHIAQGIEFLGFRFSVSETGYVYQKLLSENVKTERAKLRRIVRQVSLGHMGKAKADECYRSWRNHASSGDNHKLIVRMDAFYKSLWEVRNAKNHA